MAHATNGKRDNVGAEMNIICARHTRYYMQDAVIYEQ